MTRVAFFGHNAADAAVRRRAVAFARADIGVSGFMPHRGDAAAVDFARFDLGQTRDNAYLHRIGFIVTGSRRAAHHRAALAECDFVYARNLDMLAVAIRTLGSARLRRPVVYECLDVHHRLTGGGAQAGLLRAVERRLLARCALLVISSPAFEREYFVKTHPGRYTPFLLENRLIEGDAFPPRPSPGGGRSVGPLRVGWFGNLRCARSMSLMRMLASRFADRIRIELRGYAASSVFPDLDAEIVKSPSIRFHGRYRAPQDLQAIYSEIDLIWAMDWYEAGANSTWLLPNRLYEGGYFATPAIALRGTETARWLERNRCGFVVDDPVEETVPRLIERLLEDRSALDAKRAALLSLPRESFVEPPDTMSELAAIVTGPSQSE